MPDHSTFGQMSTEQLDELMSRPQVAARVEQARREGAQEITRLKGEVRHMQECAERRNRELDALHMVWCDGGCQNGTHRWTDDVVTPEMVEFVEAYAKRLRRWYTNREYKQARAVRGEEEG